MARGDDAALAVAMPHHAIDYDPLAANPDYLVVGRFARENGLYQPAIDSGAFRLLRSYDGYELYERAR